MKIEVTMDDIYEARRRLADKEVYRCNVCPVALALTRATGRPWSVGVRVASETKEGAPEIRLPDVASKFVMDFDCDDDESDISPFTFDLDLPATTLSREGKGE